MSRIEARMPSRSFAERLRIARRELRLNSRVLTSAEPLVRVYGHEFASLAPVLVSGPVATPGITECLIEWTVNVPAYHRVRYKKPGGGWTVTAWTTVPSTNAAINLTGL